MFGLYENGRNIAFGDILSMYLRTRSFPKWKLALILNVLVSLLDNILIGRLYCTNSYLQQVLPAGSRKQSLSPQIGLFNIGIEKSHTTSSERFRGVVGYHTSLAIVSLVIPGEGTQKEALTWNTPTQDSEKNLVIDLKGQETLSGGVPTPGSPRSCRVTRQRKQYRKSTSTDLRGQHQNGFSKPTCIDL